VCEAPICRAPLPRSVSQSKAHRKDNAADGPVTVACGCRFVHGWYVRQELASLCPDWPRDGKLVRGLPVMVTVSPHWQARSRRSVDPARACRRCGACWHCRGPSPLVWSLQRGRGVSVGSRWVLEATRFERRMSSEPASGSVRPHDERRRPAFGEVRSSAIWRPFGKFGPGDPPTRSHDLILICTSASPCRPSPLALDETMY
jgi:hypothetical protein